MNHQKIALRSSILFAVLISAYVPYTDAGVMQNGTDTLQSMAVSAPASATPSSIPSKHTTANASTKTPNPVALPASTGSGTSAANSQPAAAMPEPPPQAETILHELHGMPPVKMYSASESSMQASAEQRGLALSPSEIEQYHEMLLDSAVAAAKLPMPAASAPMVRVSLAPGQIPPVLSVSSNYVTAVTFTDKTGAPWPIVNHVLGNAMFFSATVPTSNKENVILITPLKQGVSSNIAVTLKGLTQPIIIPVKASLSHVDYREDIMVDGLGPYAKKPIFIAGPSSEVGGKTLTDVLDGIQPSGSKQVNVSGLSHTLAYYTHGMLYIRARADLVSPSWNASISNDGYTAWKLPFSSPLTFMYHGSPVSVNVSR